MHMHICMGGHHELPAPLVLMPPELLSVAQLRVGAVAGAGGSCTATRTRCERNAAVGAGGALHVSAGRAVLSNGTLLLGEGTLLHDNHAGAQEPAVAEASGSFCTAGEQATAQQSPHRGAPIRSAQPATASAPPLAEE